MTPTSRRGVCLYIDEPRAKFDETEVYSAKRNRAIGRADKVHGKYKVIIGWHGSIITYPKVTPLGHGVGTKGIVPTPWTPPLGVVRSHRKGGGTG